MKPHREFIAAGVAANHAEQLLRPTGTPEQMLAALSRPATLLERHLPAALESVFAGKAPIVRRAEAKLMSRAELNEAIGPLAGNAALGGKAGAANLIVSLEAKAILAELDRVFGGMGLVEDPLPETFSNSGRLLASRAIDAMVPVLEKAFDLGDDVQVLAFEADLAAIELLMAETQLAVQPVEFSADGETWFTITIAALPEMVLRLANKPAGSAGGNTKRQATMFDEPFAAMPLRLSARLVDMRVPLGKLAGLEAGSVLPIPVARKVPLAIGDKQVGLGTIGEQDDRVALRMIETAFAAASPSQPDDTATAPASLQTAPPNQAPFESQPPLQTPIQESAA